MPAENAENLHSDDAGDVFFFPFGIPAFGNLQRWALQATEQPPFLTLQCTQQPEFAFILVDPCLCVPHYNPHLDWSDYKILQLDSPKDSDCRIFCIVNIPSDGKIENITVNLRAPLLFNIREKQAAQCLSTDEQWQIKHKLLSVTKKDISLC